MKYLKHTGLLFFICYGVAFCQNDTTDTLKQEVLKAQSVRFSAMIEADIEKLNEMLADDLTYTHTNGWIETKSEYLATVKSKKMDYLTMTTRDVSVRVFDKTAIISGLVDVKVKYQGILRELDLRFLEVYRKVDSNWQLVASQRVKNLVE
ncbi:MAG: nuclear transport factor 2 family protein [Eudoraea sp.]